MSGHHTMTCGTPQISIIEHLKKHGKNEFFKQNFLYELKTQIVPKMQKITQKKTFYVSVITIQS